MKYLNVERTWGHYWKNFRTAPYFIMHAHLINYAFYPLSLNTIDNSLGN